MSDADRPIDPENLVAGEAVSRNRQPGDGSDSCSH